MKTLLAILAAALATGAEASSPAATQSWVNRRIGESIVTSVHTNGVTTLSAGSCRIFTEDASVFAVVATNCTAAAAASGVTNGMWFVWNDGLSAYTNRTQVISSTPSNLVWNAHSSSNDVFVGYFGVKGYIIQPMRAKEVTE